MKTFIKKAMMTIIKKSKAGFFIKRQLSLPYSMLGIMLLLSCFLLSLLLSLTLAGCSQPKPKNSYGKKSSFSENSKFSKNIKDSKNTKELKAIKSSMASGRDKPNELERQNQQKEQLSNA